MPIQCESCGKNPATIHVTEVSGGQVVEHHYCEECAAQSAKLPGQETQGAAELLAKLIKLVGAKAEEEARIVCPSCGISLADFRSTGRLGCPADYEAFSEHLTPLLEKFHGAAVHTGRGPKSRGSPEALRFRRLLLLRRQLDEAVQQEAYDRAAKLRDEIYRLRQEQDNAGS